MVIHHGKDDKPKKCECPACKQVFTPQNILFFPREVWHPRRTYGFFRGYQCENCGYLATVDQVLKLQQPNEQRIQLR